MARIATFLLEKVLPASSRAGRRPIFLDHSGSRNRGQGETGGKSQLCAWRRRHDCAREGRKMELMGARAPR
jgi:hypothetical protein